MAALPTTCVLCTTSPVVRAEFWSRAELAKQGKPQALRHSIILPLVMVSDSETGQKHLLRNVPSSYDVSVVWECRRVSDKAVRGRVEIPVTFRTVMDAPDLVICCDLKEQYQNAEDDPRSQQLGYTRRLWRYIRRSVWRSDQPVVSTSADLLSLTDTIKHSDEKQCNDVCKASLIVIGTDADGVRVEWRAQHKLAGMNDGTDDWVFVHNGPRFGTQMQSCVPTMHLQPLQHELTDMACRQYLMVHLTRAVVIAMLLEKPGIAAPSPRDDVMHVLAMAPRLMHQLWACDRMLPASWLLDTTLHSYWAEDFQVITLRYVPSRDSPPCRVVLNILQTRSRKFKDFIGTTAFRQQQASCWDDQTATSCLAIPVTWIFQLAPLLIHACAQMGLLNQLELGVTNTTRSLGTARPVYDIMPESEQWPLVLDQVPAMPSPVIIADVEVTRQDATKLAEDHDGSGDVAMTDVQTDVSDSTGCLRVAITAQVPINLASVYCCVRTDDHEQAPMLVPMQRRDALDGEGSVYTAEYPMVAILGPRPISVFLATEDGEMHLHPILYYNASYCWSTYRDVPHGWQESASVYQIPELSMGLEPLPDWKIDAANAELQPVTLDDMKEMAAKEIKVMADALKYQKPSPGNDSLADLLYAMNLAS